MMAPERHVAAIGRMMSGLTVAPVVGAPTTSLVGQWLGWRPSFARVGSLCPARQSARGGHVAGGRGRGCSDPALSTIVPIHYGDLDRPPAYAEAADVVERLRGATTAAGVPLSDLGSVAGTRLIARNGTRSSFGLPAPNGEHAERLDRGGTAGGSTSTQLVLRFADGGPASARSAHSSHKRQAFSPLTSLWHASRPPELPTARV